MTGPVLVVDDLHVHFKRRGRPQVKAVDGVSFAVHHGETLGLVGESGCGKTTLTRALLGLVRPTSGRVLLQGRDVGRLSRRGRRPFRPAMQVVFQDPYSALNPRMTVRELVGEPLRVQGRHDRRRVDDLLCDVGLDPAVGDRHPATFSGGQRQRIGIARALALDPELLVLDEPVSALDVSVQAQVINLLRRLQRERGLTYLFIAHDLAVVRHMSHQVAVMYLGRIAEHGPRDEVFGAPRHPYTRSLLAAVPIADPAARDRARDRLIVGGDLPDPAHPPSGCRFRTRCPDVRPSCAESEPGPAEHLFAGDHRAACFFPEVSP